MQTAIAKIKEAIAHVKANIPETVRVKALVGHLTEALQHGENELKYAAEDAAKAVADLEAAKAKVATVVSGGVPTPAATATKPVKLPE